MLWISNYVDLGRACFRHCASRRRGCVDARVAVADLLVVTLSNLQIGRLLGLNVWQNALNLENSTGYKGWVSCVVLILCLSIYELLVLSLPTSHIDISLI